MTDAVRKLVEAARTTPCQTIEGASRLANAARAVEAEAAREEEVSTTYECSECESPIDPRTDVVVCSECLIAAREKAEACEHAIARKALEAIGKNVPSTGCGIPNIRNAEGIIDDVRTELDRQLSLLGARNVECVEIPCGKSCEAESDAYPRCPFNLKNRQCGNPSRPNEDPYANRWCDELGHMQREDWCLSRYGVEAKP